MLEKQHFIHWAQVCQKRTERERDGMQVGQVYGNGGTKCLFCASVEQSCRLAACLPTTKSHPEGSLKGEVYTSVNTKMHKHRGGGGERKPGLHKGIVVL